MTMFSAQKRGSNFRSICLVTCMLQLLCAIPASAMTPITEKDLQIAARSFNFVNGIPKDNLVIGIVFDAAIPASSADKDQFVSIVGAGLKAGSTNIVAKPIALADLGSNIGLVNIVYFTEGMAADYDAAFNIAKSKKVLSFSKDTACIDAQKCVMSVNSDPAVEIIVSKQATDQTGVDFATAMRLMVKERT